jgi:hypothetical protein
MATDLQNPTQTSTSALVGGILDDVQDLVKQQVQLTRKEIELEMHKVAEAAQFFALGGAVLFFGVFMLGLMLVHLVHWATSPAGTDPATIPLWGCYAIIGGPLAILGGILAWMGSQRLSAINPLNNPATEEFKKYVKVATLKSP